MRGTWSPKFIRFESTYKGIPYLSFSELNSIESTESIELVENFFQLF